MGQIAFLSGGIRSWHFLLVVAIVVVTAIFIRFYGDKKEEEDPETIAEIERARSAEELIDIVGEHYSLIGRENDVFLKRALELGLRKHDWAGVYCVAKEGSKLEKVAKENAGSELD